MSTEIKTGEVIEPTREIHRIAGKVEKEGDLVGWPAYDESAAYHQWSDKCVASSWVSSGVSTGNHLKN